MKPFSLLPLSIMALAMPGCAWQPASAQTRCGRFFCVDLGPSDSFSKNAPLADFDLYQVQRSGRTFVIYEGYNPDTANAKLVRRIRTTYGTASLLREDGVFVGEFRNEGFRGTSYVSVSTACGNGDECDMASFLSLFNHPEQRDPEQQDDLRI